MSSEFEHLDANHVVESYQAGETIHHIIRRLRKAGVNRADLFVPQALKNAGIRISPNVTKAKQRLRKAGWGDGFSSKDIVDEYVGGMSPIALGRKYGIGRAGVLSILRWENVPLRGMSEANQIAANRRTREEAMALTAAARAAKRGRPNSWESMCRSARTRELRQRFATPESRWFHEMLDLPNAVLEKAVGKYNIDVAAFPVAVELFGGGFHAFSNAARAQERSEYILNQGWSLIFIWVTKSHPLTGEAVHRVLELHEMLESDPPTPGKYWVIWGTGEDVPATETYFHQGTGVPAPGSSNNA